ncbi:MAG: hypothetical protein WAL71_04285 [Terriglobales bacterium]|jgi:hypothetical protein
MRIYSNAWVSKEAGDLLGYELAVKESGDGKLDALLYVYEGAPDDGILLPGRINGKHVTIEGDWIEHQVEYPSKKEIIQTHLVRIEGALDLTSFHGRLTIKDLSVDSDLKLRRVQHIWFCKP